MSPSPPIPAFGDLVICEPGEHATAFGVADRPGIVVETRRRDARVLYVDPDRSIWLPLEAIRPARSGETEGAPLAIAAALLSRLGAIGLEAALSRGAAGATLRLTIAHGAIAAEALDALRREIGDRLAGWRLRPAGLHRIESVVDVLWEGD